jgi:hypothetical protein
VGAMMASGRGGAPRMMAPDFSGRRVCSSFGRAEAAAWSELELSMT